MINKLDEIVLLYCKCLAKVEHVQEDFVVASHLVLQSESTARAVDSETYQQLVIKALLNLARHIFADFAASHTYSTMNFRCGHPQDLSVLLE